MRTHGMRWTDTAADVHRCEVRGCDARALFGRHCLRCAGEIDALREMAARRDERNGRLRMAAFNARVVARRLLWIPILIVVLAGIAVMAVGWGEAVIEWLQ